MLEQCISQMNDLDGDDEFAEEMWEQVTGSFSFVSFLLVPGVILEL